MSSNRALILVDIQNDYFSGGLWPIETMNDVAHRAAEVLNDFRVAHEMVIHIRHEALSDTAPFFRPDTTGAQIHPSVSPVAEEPIIVKHRPNSFHKTDLHACLQAAGITDLTIIGAMTQMCIDATARAARDLGYEVTLVADACGAKATNFHDQSLSSAQVQAAFLSALEMSYVTLV